MSESLVFLSSPIVTMATNTFVNVPIILKYEDTPMFEIVQDVGIGFTVQIPIYHSDGTYLAKVKGNRIYPTPDGKKARITVDQPFGKTICKLNDKVLFELSHGVGDQFKADAELHTSDGYFLRCTDLPKPELFDRKSNSIQVGGVTMSHCKFENMSVGIWLKSDGSLSIGTR